MNLIGWAIIVGVIGLIITLLGLISIDDPYPTPLLGIFFLIAAGIMTAIWFVIAKGQWGS